ncbi:hypothetical protein GF324_08320 [bacterium]|nr:hypothetical protein [bacterium]
MHYLVAADGPTLDAPISKRFGHASFHLLVNSETMKVVKMEGGEVESFPAHGIQRFCYTIKVDGVIAGNIGPHAFEDIRREGWPMYIVRKSTVREAIEKVAAGDVVAATEPSMKRSIGRHPGHEPGDGHGRGEGHGGGQGRGGQGYGGGHSGGQGSGGGQGRHGKAQHGKGGYRRGRYGSGGGRG